MSRTRDCSQSEAAIGTGNGMRIAFTADLHLGITTENALAELADDMRADELDALVVLGDIGEGPTAFGRALELFGDVAPVRACVPGNHDVWRREGFGSEELYSECLPAVARDQGFDWLEDRVLRLRHVTVIASMAWYDYSAVGPEFAHHPLAMIESSKASFNNDAVYINWPSTDIEVAEACRRRVTRRLEEAERDSGIETVIIATHVPILEEQMVRRHGDRRWSFSNAYFGHLSLGRIVLDSPKVAKVISGHTHVARHAWVDRPGLRPVESVVIVSDYGSAAWFTVEL